MEWKKPEIRSFSEEQLLLQLEVQANYHQDFPDGGHGDGH